MQAEQSFSEKLAVVQTIEEAWALVRRAPPHSDPTRAHYSNLGFFLQSEYRVPNGAKHWEATEYLRLFDQFVANGLAISGGAQSVRDAIVREIKARERWDGSPLP